MKKYIDCDGVVLNTEKGLFDNYHILKKQNPSLTRKNYIQNLDWRNWLEQAGDLNDAIYILKNYPPDDAELLTRFYSMNEGGCKVKYLRSRGVRNNIILVPDDLCKSQIVTACGNILVDDSNGNLEDWNNNFGIPFYFGDDISEFDRVESLDEVLNPKKLELRLKSRIIRQ